MRCYIGHFLFKLKQYDTAIQKYKEVIKKDTLNTLAFLNWGYILNEKKKYNDAIDVLKKVIQIDSACSLANYLLGEAYIGNGQTNDAIKHLSRYLIQDPDGIYASQARQYIRFKEFIEY